MLRFLSGMKTNCFSTKERCETFATLRNSPVTPFEASHYSGRHRQVLSPTLEERKRRNAEISLEDLQKMYRSPKEEKEEESFEVWPAHTPWLSVPAWPSLAVGLARFNFRRLYFQIHHACERELHRL